MSKELRMKLPGLEGLKVAISAGGGGIGLCIARVLAEQGVELAICDVDRDAGRLAPVVGAGLPDWLPGNGLRRRYHSDRCILGIAGSPRCLRPRHARRTGRARF